MTVFVVYERGTRWLPREFSYCCYVSLAALSLRSPRCLLFGDYDYSSRPFVSPVPPRAHARSFPPSMTRDYSLTKAIVGRRALLSWLWLWTDCSLVVALGLELAAQFKRAKKLSLGWALPVIALHG